MRTTIPSNPGTSQGPCEKPSPIKGQMQELEALQEQLSAIVQRLENKLETVIPQLPMPVDPRDKEPQKEVCSELYDYLRKRILVTRDQISMIDRMLDRIEL